MLDFLKRRPGLGLEIQPAALRLAVLSGGGPSLSILHSHTAPLPRDMVGDDFGSPNIHDPEAFSGILKDCLAEAGLKTRRAGLSLPDSVFRVQALEFDALPRTHSEVQSLIRWRFDKTGVIDTSGTVLRYQAFKGKDKGFTVLACVIREDVLSQYENVLLGAGIKPWVVGISSVHELNFYSDYLSSKAPLFGFARVTEDAFSIIVMEQGIPRFYRFKEIKKGGPREIQDRLMRELEDSLHFYAHMDRQQHPEVRHLFLAGDFPALDGLAQSLTSGTSFEVELLSPASVLPHTGKRRAAEGTVALAAAFGAGGAL